MFYVSLVSFPVIWLLQRPAYSLGRAVRPEAKAELPSGAIPVVGPEPARESVPLRE
jgi:hypothetical protein